MAEVQKTSLWHGLLGLCRWIGVLLVLIGIYSCYLPLIEEAAVLSMQKIDLLRSIDKTKMEINQLQRVLEKLRSDAGYIERVAREELRLVRPGECVIFFSQDRVQADSAKSGGSNKN